jgi:hypothetical protein
MTHTYTKPLNSMYKEIRVINNMYLTGNINTEAYRKLKENVLSQVVVSHLPVVANKFVV